MVMNVPNKTYTFQLVKVRVISICFAITFFLSLYSSSMASNLSIEVQTPQSGMQISGELPIKVLIKEGDKPLTIREGLQWVSGVLLEENGRELFRIALQDNGKGEDNKPNDGYWASPWKIKLHKGQYLFSISVKRDKEIMYSPKLGFSVIPERVIIPKEKTEEPFYKDIVELSYKADGIIQAILITIILLSVTLLAVGANILVPILKRRRTKESLPVDERWGPILTALDEASKKISETEREVSSTFHIHRELKEKYGKILEDVIDNYEFAVGWTDAPEEYIEPFRAKIWEALKRQGIEIWEPEIGKPVPENCEKKPASEDYPYPPGCVAKVHSLGFRIKEGEKFNVIKLPLVEVVIEKVPKEV